MKKGELTELIFYNTCIQYRNQGKLSFFKTFPEFTVIEPGKKARRGNKGTLTKGFFNDKALPDWHITVNRNDGLSIPVWMDTKGVTTDKTWYNLTGAAIAQWDRMIEDLNDSNTLGFFFVEWMSPENSNDREWLLFPVNEVYPNDSRKHIKIKKKDGIPAPLDGDTPDFLPIIIWFYEKRSIHGTLADNLPFEFLTGEYNHTKAFGFRDMIVVDSYGFTMDSELDKEFIPWPGKHKNVHNWYVLRNGMAVGWNENPGTGWSFPVINYKAFMNIYREDN